MKDVYDLNSGLYYCAMTSQPEPAKKHSTLGEGAAIIGGFFLCALAIVIAI